MAAKIKQIMAGSIELLIDPDFNDGKPCISLNNYSITVMNRGECADLIDALRIAAKQVRLSTPAHPLNMFMSVWMTTKMSSCTFTRYQLNHYQRNNKAIQWRQRETDLNEAAGGRVPLVSD
jgi:hypothetical protein